ncbi:hypothetical protein FHS18_002303 [Paenibacillus phyllosphaerae]|uniref:CvpA family protein n=1 Tax=Paenibacillus phyllosphaerae TaxID=274593 RepID=A0A7W5AXS2_9BACL|nr:hypothetical protein [Paenibacillus phyllosphaerae]MBB3110236.1 hypothetical protein [Paenibacillus phyllosphaerae]
MFFWFVVFTIAFLLLTPTLWMRRHYGWQAIKLLLAFVYGGIFVGYLWLVDQTASAVIMQLAFLYPIALTLDLTMLMMGSAATGKRRPKEASQRANRSSLPTLGFSVAGILFAAWIVLVAVYPLFVKDDLYDIVKAQETSEKIAATDIQHIPTVPKETAEYVADKLIGGIPKASYYQLGELTRQKIGAEEFWLAPIEYKGFFESWNAKSLPGFIKVSAEDKDRPAEFVDQESFTYSPSAYFGDDLMRKVRSQYPKDILRFAGFEPDENEKPYWIVSYGHYKNFRNGFVLDGAIIVDARTGEMTKYKLSDLPPFVDFAVPPSVAFDYNQWHAKYKHGWWNTLFGKKDIYEVTEWNTGEEVIGLFGPDKQMYWFTDHTTRGTNSMVGYTLMNGRTGEYTYYTGTKGMSDGKAAIEAVNNTFLKDAWTGTNSILYNIYGEEAWYIPVIDTKGVLRKIAIVNARNTQIVAYGDSKLNAFNSYKVRMAASKSNTNDAPTNAADSKQITGKVLRLGEMTVENITLIQILLEGSDKIFMANPQAIVYAPFMKEGDTVRITYTDTEEQIVSVDQLYNVTIGK